MYKKLDQALILAALLFVSSNVYGASSYGDAGNNYRRISTARGTSGRSDQSGNYSQNRNTPTDIYRTGSSDDLIRGERSPDVGEEWESKTENEGWERELELATERADREKGYNYQKNPQETLEYLMECVRNNQLNEIDRVFDIIPFKRSGLVNFVTTIKHGNKMSDREIQAHSSNTFKAIGSFINMQDGRGMTLLHEAVQCGNIDIVKYLIDRGADVNKKDKLGRTPLLCVTWYYTNASDIVKILLESGADPNTKDSKKEGNTPLARACEMGNENSAKLLVKYGANVNEKNGLGYVPFQYCVWGIPDRCSASLAKFLVDQGADINVKGKEGRTLLIYAVEAKRLDIVKLLINLGADVNMKGVAQNLMNKKERTPLEIAEYYSDFSEEYLEIIELLQKHGAKS